MNICNPSASGRAAHRHQHNALLHASDIFAAKQFILPVMLLAAWVVNADNRDQDRDAIYSLDLCFCEAPAVHVAEEPDEAVDGR